MVVRPAPTTPRDFRCERAVRRPLVGAMLLVIAVLHLLAAPLFYGEALTSIIDGGVFGAVDANPSAIDLRSSGFWYLIAGIALTFISANVTWIERHHGRAPAHVGWMLLVLGGFGVMLMPVSPFWLFFVAAAMVAHSRRSRQDPTRVEGGLALPVRARGQWRSWRSWVAPAAGLWSLAITAVGGVWAAGLIGSPFGLGDPRATNVGSLLEGLDSQQVGWIAIIVGLTGVLTALAAWRMPARPWLVIPALGLSLILLLVIPDVRVIQNFAYLFFGYIGLWDAPLAAMLVSMVGGVLWLLVAVAQLPRGPSLGAVLRPPRWSVAVTYTAAALALPYGLVRASWGLGIPLGTTEAALDIFPWWQRLGLVLIFGGLPFAGAVLTIGLVRPWGRVFPGWIPWLGGRPVPVWAAVLPGGIAAALVCQMGLRVTPGALLHLDEMTWTSWGPELPGLFILPWGIALAIAVYAYAVGRLPTSRRQPLSQREDPQQSVPASES